MIERAPLRRSLTRLLAMVRALNAIAADSPREAAMYAPGHRNEVTNQKLRQRGYFQKRYREKINAAITAARKSRKRGLRGEALIDQLRKERGRTMERRLDNTRVDARESQFERD